MRTFQLMPIVISHQKSQKWRKITTLIVLYEILTTYEGSSRSQMFFKTGVLKNFGIFTGKHLCWSLFLIKLLAWSPATVLKRESTQVFSWEYYEVFKNSFFLQNTSCGCSCYDLEKILKFCFPQKSPVIMQFRIPFRSMKLKS